MRPAHYQTRFKDRLTPRQSEVAELLARGKTNAEIANALNLGWETVKSHVSEILMKLEVDSREAAAERLRRERSLGAALTRPFQALVGLGWPKLVSGGLAASFGVLSAALLLASAVSREELEIEPVQPDAAPVSPAAVVRLGTVSTCCVAHQLVAIGTSAWFVTGANITNWQSQLYRLDQGGGALEGVDLDFWPLVLASSPEGALWTSRPASYDFDKSARDLQRQIPGEPGALSLVSRLDTTTFAELASFTVPARVGQLRADLASIWAISDQDNLVLQFDAESGTELHRFELTRIGHASIDGPHLWVTLTRLDRIVRLNGLTGAIDFDLPVPVECVCAGQIVTTREAIWVTQYARDSLLRIDRADPLSMEEVKTEPGPNRIGVGPDGSLWVVFSGLDGMTLARLDPSTAVVLERKPIGSFGGSVDGLVITQESVWVTGQKGEVVRVGR